MMKKLYNFYRNVRSFLVVNFYKKIYCHKIIIGKNVYVRKAFQVVIEENGKITIGDNVFFNNFCSLNALDNISIGKDCIFGENVHIYDHNHIYKTKDIPINNQGFTTKEISIGENCWIGSNVTILKGVKIGDNVIIGAGCVIYKDVASGSIIVNGSQNKNLHEVK